MGHFRWGIQQTEWKTRRKIKNCGILEQIIFDAIDQNREVYVQQTAEKALIMKNKWLTL